jgi:uncharacterized protein YyaL (SSP411 family)
MRKDASTRRFAHLLARSVRDTAGRQGKPRGDAIEAGIRWLCLTHDVTGRRGSSKGYSLLRGWFPAFPETTGYVIGTMLAYAARTGDDACRQRALEMGDWEVEVQRPDGGVMEGLLTARPKPSTVFNTGMVIHGWLDLHEIAPSDARLAAAQRAGRFLLLHQDADGAWRGAAEYFGIPHTYCARVSWALVRLAALTGDDSYRAAARRQLDWVVSMQRDNGWFAACNFKPGRDPNTHGIAYTLRGLLESAALLEHAPYLAAVERTSAPLIALVEEGRGRLRATFNPEWRATARYECLTGIAQLGGVWLRLHELTGDPRYRAAGTAAVERAARAQARSRWKAIDGALPGSYPIYGRYAPLQFPNWATKFLVDSLMLRERVSS